MPNGDQHTYTAYELGDATIRAQRNTAVAILRAALGAAAQRMGPAEEHKTRAVAVMALMEEEGIVAEVEALIEHRREQIRTDVQRHNAMVARLQGSGFDG